MPNAWTFKKVRSLTEKDLNKKLSNFQGDGSIILILCIFLISLIIGRYIERLEISKMNKYEFVSWRFYWHKVNYSIK